MTFSQPTAGRQQTLPAEPCAHAQTGARRAGLRSHRGCFPARRQSELSDSSQASSLLGPQRLTAAVSLKWPQSPTRQSLPLRPPNSPPSLAAPSVGTHLGPAHGPASPPGDPHPTSKPLLTCDPSAGSVTPAPCHFPRLVSCRTCHTAVGFAASLLGHLSCPAPPQTSPGQGSVSFTARPSRWKLHPQDGTDARASRRARAVPSIHADPSPTHRRPHRHGPARVTQGTGGATHLATPLPTRPPHPALPHLSLWLEQA